LQSYVQQNRILKTQKNSGGNYEVSTSLVKYSTEYKVSVVISSDSKKSKHPIKEVKDTKVSVCEFFDEEGTFLRNQFYQFLENLKNRKSK